MSEYGITTNIKEGESPITSYYSYENWLEVQKELKRLRIPYTTCSREKKPHWIRTGDYFTGAYQNLDYFTCSVCGEEVIDANDFSYCPYCGAKMTDDTKY